MRKSHKTARMSVLKAVEGTNEENGGVKSSFFFLALDIASVSETSGGFLIWPIKMEEVLNGFNLQQQNLL